MAMAESRTTTTTHVSPARRAKEAKVAVLAQELLDKKVAALVGIRGVPASNLQNMRKELAAKGHPLRVAPNSLIVHALEQAAKSRPKLKELIPLVTDQTALLVADANPFALFQELDKTRSPVAARGGEVAPKDILVPAGETPFKPGPIVGELQHAGFPAAIEKGKVVIKKDTIIVKAGAVISREVGPLLARLEIKPLEVGLLLRAAAEVDTVYKHDELAVDFEALRGDAVRAHRQALALAVKIGWATPESVPPMLATAHRQAMGLALAAGFATPETVVPLLEKAARQARQIDSLQSS